MMARFHAVQSKSSWTGRGAWGHPPPSAQERLVQPAFDMDDLASAPAQACAGELDDPLGLVGRGDRLPGQRPLRIGARQRRAPVLLRERCEAFSAEGAFMACEVGIGLGDDLLGRTCPAKPFCPEPMT